LIDLCHVSIDEWAFWVDLKCAGRANGRKSVNIIFVNMIISVHQPNETLGTIFKECYYLQMDANVGPRRIPVIDDCCYDLVFFKEASGAFYFGEDSRKAAESFQFIKNESGTYKTLMGWKGIVVEGKRN